MSKLTLKTVFLLVKKHLKRLIYSLLIIIPVTVLGFWGYTEFASYSPDQVILSAAYGDKNVKLMKKQAILKLLQLL